MTVHISGEPIEGVIALLRAEEPLEAQASQQALLRHECGVLEEQRGDDAAALREHLAACDAAPDFREPIEALLRIYRRLGEERHLPRLLEMLVDATATPADHGRALWELAAYRLSAQDDRAGARLCLERALESDASDAIAWLELELLAARDGDVEARARALEARAGLSSDPTWQGLLLTELAELRAQAGDLERAATLLDMAVALDGRGRFGSRLALEAIARRASDQELEAHALEGQAELIALGLEDPEAARRAGVPATLCLPEVAADAWLRAGELRRRSGDGWGAVAALTGAAERLPNHPVVARLRLAASDAAGDADGALRIAREQLERGASGPTAAPLWLRLALAAESERDHGAALEAYAKALEQDPTCLAAQARRLDLLAKGGDAELFAHALEAEAETLVSDRAKARAWLAIAYVWAVRAHNAGRAKAALDRATGAGVAVDRCARVARVLASLADASAWYEEATEALLASGGELPDRAHLCLELVRLCLVRGDAAGTLAALDRLGAASDGAGVWLARALAAYGVGGGTGGGHETRDAKRVAALAEVEPDEALGRGLALVAATLASRSGDRDGALALLEREREREPGNVAVALLVADLRRRGGETPAATEVLSRCAASCSDPQLAGALQLEAAFLSWRAGQTNEAIGAFELAIEHAPVAARTALGWALHAVDPDDLAVRRRAIDFAEESSAERATGALERFGLGAALAGSEADAWAALEQLDELDPGGDLAAAGAIARVAWGDGSDDRDAHERALAKLEELGGEAVAIARAERFRIARVLDRDDASALSSARAWSEVDDGLAPVLEWAAAATATGDRAEELAARRAIAGRVDGALRAAIGASAATAQLVAEPARVQPFVEGRDAMARLANLELAPPGSEPRRRAAALRGMGEALGEEALADAERLAAWSDLARGAWDEAKRAFRALCERDGKDLASWEGLRVAAEKLDDHLTIGLACAQLGNLCKDDARAAEWWEKAGLVLLEKTQAHDDAEIALERALERDARRPVAFDKLFRRVRGRNEDDKLLRLIDRRLKVTEDTAETTKMYWERSRVLRRRGDEDGALKCLRDVTLLEPDHVGALALAGEIYIARKDFAEAAPLLARLAGLEEPPRDHRLKSAVLAANLYDEKLDKPEKALEVLLDAYRMGLSTPKVRERLAAVATRVGQWEAAVDILERLMGERDTSEGRAEAARLAMAVYRDKIGKPARAEKAVRKLLEEIPDDPEAVDLLLRGAIPGELRQLAVPRARDVLRKRLLEDPCDADRVALLAEIAAAEGDGALERAALGVIAALCPLGSGRHSAKLDQTRAALDARTPQHPSMNLSDAAIGEIADPEDRGPLADLFAHLGPIITEALGPTRDSEGVGRKQRVDSGPLRLEVSRWVSALGIGDFVLFSGGRSNKTVVGVAESPPELILKAGTEQPLDVATRSAVAREVFALRRGTSALLHWDDHTIASIAVAVSNEVDVAAPEPPYAVFPEVSRHVRKAVPWRMKKQLKPICEAVLAARQDPLAWAQAARRSIDRMQLLAAGDAAVVIDLVVGAEGTPARSALAKNERARCILSFALSPEYLALRKKLGMGVGEQ